MTDKIHPVPLPTSVMASRRSYDAARGQDAKDIQYWLDNMTVFWRIEPELYRGPKGYCSFANEHGIVAYFKEQDDAFRYRIAEVNRALNPGTKRRGGGFSHDDHWFVLRVEDDMLEETSQLEGWFAACNDDDGYLAYFGSQQDANRFILSEIVRAQG